MKTRTQRRMTTAQTPMTFPQMRQGLARSSRRTHLWQKAYNASQNRKNLFIAVPWVTAREWMARDRSFAVKADIGDLLAQPGSGVYSLTVWGSVGGEDAVISQYSIFHNVAPPDTYTTDARVGPGSSPQEAATGLEDQRTPAPSTTYLEPAPTTLTVGERMEVVLRSNRDSLYLTHGTSIGIGPNGDPHGEWAGHHYEQQRMSAGGYSCNRRGCPRLCLRRHRLQCGSGEHHRPRWQWQRAGAVLNTS